MDIRQKAAATIATLLERDEATIDESEALFSLVDSSFRVVELVIELQEEFGVQFHQADMNRVATLGDLLDLVARRYVAPGQR